MTVDGDNRQTAQLDSYTGATPISSTAGFDPDGNLVSQLQTIGSQSHAFSATLNPADWPQQATNDGLTSSTIGTGGGDVLAQTIQNQAGTVTYNIDQAGRDNQIGVLSMGSTTPLTTTYAFNDNEQMTGVALPNNVEQDAGYDGANRLVSLSAQNTANHTLLNNLYQYGYDPLGLTTAITTTVQGSATSQSLSHDAAGRLTAVSGTGPTGSWTYDGRGNLTSATVSGVTTSISGQPTTYYGYDGAGDTTSITNTSSLNRQLSYDAQTRLVQITFGSPITQTVMITYTAFGQRANYAVTPAGAGQPSLSEHFWYQGDQLSQVAYTGTSITTPYTDTYVYSQDGAPLELLRQMGSTTTPYWYVLDGQGNVVALTNGSGSVVDSYTYDQWGKPLTVSESVPQQLRYAGSWYDNELGWYWLSVRPYDPNLERFLQPDPSEQEGLFSYIYAGDNPSDLGDPSGLFPIPLPSGNLVTPAPGPFSENNVAVGSDQWNAELGHGTKPYGGLVGATVAALLPGMCGMAAVCGIRNRTQRTVATVGVTAAYSVSFGMDFWGLPDPCSIAPFGCAFVSQLGGEVTGALNWLCNVGICHAVNELCDVSGVCYDISTLASNAAWYKKLGAAGDLLLWVPGLDEFKVVEFGGRTVEAEGKLVRTAIAVGGCALCFPAGTLVATPGGQRPIETLHVGDQVLAEDPTTGKVAVERVQAVRKDPASPLMEVRLSDGSSIKVTVDHPFWVDGNADFANAGWRAAGELQVGDRLRTASGADVTVVGLRYHVGQAVVYTLTVSQDHTFFVGSARVLVHNAACVNTLKSVVKEDKVLLNYARQAGKDTIWQDQIDNLLKNIMNGAIIRKDSITGTGIIEVTGGGEARVYLLETGKNAYTIVGYSNKDNQRAVINRLIQLYRR